MPCEMCGSEGNLRKATIEGTTMNVCPRCARFGVEVTGHQKEVTGRSKITTSLENRRRRSRPRDVYDQMEEELVEDYGQVVREARLRKGFDTTEELAKRLNEKKSTIDKVESASLHPPDALVKKLESALDIKLMEKDEAVFRPDTGGGGRKNLTLGDLIKKQLDEKE